MAKATLTVKNMKAWLTGNLRYRIYYSKSPLIRALMRTHIREQIGFRISFMDGNCYMEGSCKMCGCSTTHLQCANKACDKPCYPEMMSKVDWMMFMAEYPVTDKHGTWRYVPAGRSSSGKAFVVQTRGHAFSPLPPNTIYLNQNQN